MNIAGSGPAASPNSVIDDYLDALLDENAPAAADVPPPRAALAAVPDAPVPAAPEPAPAPAAPVAQATQATQATQPQQTITLAAPSRWLRVTVCADSYALELLCVQEVVRLVPIVAMRGATRAVLGVMNLRGRIVPVLDLGLWLGTACVQPDERSRIVVVERNDELIGVLVSTVEDVVTLPRERIEPPLPGSDPGPMVGVARVGPRPTVLFDANALYG